MLVFVYTSLFLELFLFDFSSSFIVLSSKGSVTYGISSTWRVGKEYFCGVFKCPLRDYLFWGIIVWICKGDCAYSRKYIFRISRSEICRMKSISISKWPYGEGIASRYNHLCFTSDQVPFSEPCSWPPSQISLVVFSNRITFNQRCVTHMATISWPFY